MLILGVLYGAGLYLVGLDLGILIGVVGGLLTFVPYLGPTTVIVLGSIASMVQFGAWTHLLGVVAVWGIGQVIESYWLTPKLVGDRRSAERRVGNGGCCTVRSRWSPSNSTKKKQKK